jgi:hypothetical protein
VCQRASTTHNPHPARRTSDLPARPRAPSYPALTFAIGDGMGGLADVERPLLEERTHPVRPWVAAGLLLIVVLAVAGALYYAPLELGELRCEDPAELVPAPESEAGAVGRERCLLTATADAEEVVLGVVMTNTGPLPITVEEVRLDGPVSELLAIRDLRTRQGASAPLAVPAGESVPLELHLEVRACDPTRGERLLTLTELPVRTRFLGLPKTNGATLTTELSVLRSSC